MSAGMKLPKIFMLIRYSQVLSSAGAKLTPGTMIQSKVRINPEAKRGPSRAIAKAA
jgi:hypothetical protein